MKDVPDDRVSVYVVWDPVFGGSFDREAKKLSTSFPDKRVSYFKDPSSLAGNLWERILDTENESGIAWDVYLLYGADAQWEKEPAQPAFWMHQLRGVTKAPNFDVPTFTAKLKDMLGEIKTPGATEAAPTNDRAKDRVSLLSGLPWTQTGSSKSQGSFGREWETSGPYFDKK